MEPVEIDFGRMNPGVDPHLEIWEWQIPLYLFLGGMAAGIMVLTAVTELGGNAPRSKALRLAPFGALALISVGMGALFLDLAHQLYVWRFYLAFHPTSPMSWGAWILMVVYPVGLLHGLGALPDDLIAGVESRSAAAGALLRRAAAFAASVRRPVLWLSVALGVGLGVYTGLLLGTTPSRLLWNSAVLGPLFLVSGVSTGAASLILLPIEDAERHRLARLDVGAMLVELALLGLFLVGLATGGAPQRAAASVLLGGEWTAPFWALVVLLGLVTPLGLEAAEMRLGRPFIRLAPILVLVGGLSLRAILVAAGQETSFRMLP